MLTIELVKKHLRVDGSYDDELITHYMGVAKAYIADAITNYDMLVQDVRFGAKADMCELIIITDLYENRNQADKTNKDYGYTIRSMLTQLQYGG